MTGAGWRLAAALLDSMEDTRKKRQRLSLSILAVVLSLLFLVLTLFPILTLLLFHSSNNAKAPAQTPGIHAATDVPRKGYDLPVEKSGFCWPVPGHTHITSPYGYRVHPITGKIKFHAGVDIGAPSGLPIHAAAAGRITISVYSPSYGNYVEIDHGNGVRTRYAHMSKRLCSVGDTVAQGDVIGLVGATGHATGPHLHFEVRVNGKTYNPMQYFS